MIRDKVIHDVGFVVSGTLSI